MFEKMFSKYVSIPNIAPVTRESFDRDGLDIFIFIFSRLFSGALTLTPQGIYSVLFIVVQMIFCGLSF